MLEPKKDDHFFTTRLGVLTTFIVGGIILALIMIPLADALMPVNAQAETPDRIIRRIETFSDITTTIPTALLNTTVEQTTKENVIKKLDYELAPGTGDVLTDEKFKYDEVAKEEDRVIQNDKKKYDESDASESKDVDYADIEAEEITQETTQPTASITSLPTTTSTTACITTTNKTSTVKTTSKSNTKTTVKTTVKTTIKTTAKATTTKAATTTAKTTQAPSNGWNTINGKKYYYYNGEALKGWQKIGGRRYYFDEKTGEKKSQFGIDVSSWQEGVDWKKAKNDGVEFAYIRVGYRGYGTGRIVLDPYFEQNLKNAQAVGIPVGIYFYSCATNKTEAIEEAKFCLNAVSGYKLQLPIVYDIECTDGRMAGLSASTLTANTIAFMNEIEAGGYDSSYYTYYYFWRDQMYPSQLKPYELWIAYYSNCTGDKVVADAPYKAWQYSDSGSVSGVSGNVDINVRLL